MQTGCEAIDVCAIGAQGFLGAILAQVSSKKLEDGTCDAGATEDVVEGDMGGTDVMFAELMQETVEGLEDCFGREDGGAG